MGRQALTSPLSALQAASGQVLLIDEDPTAASRPAIHMLRQAGFTVEHRSALGDALAALRRRAYSLIVFEIASTGFDGEDACRRIVEADGPPLLVWSRRADAFDQVAAFELGVDEYVGKSAHPLELVARARALLRLVRRHDRGRGGELRAWRFSPGSASIAAPDGRLTYLSAGTVEALKVLAARPRRVLPRAELAMEICGTAGAAASRAVDVRLSRLRRALESCDGAGFMLRTVRPLGYRFDADVEPFGADLIMRP